MATQGFTPTELSTGGMDLGGVAVKQYIPTPAAARLTSGGTRLTPLEAKVTGPVTFTAFRPDFSVRTCVPVLGFGSRL